MRLSRVLPILAGAALLAASTATASAESVVLLRNGDKLAGPVPAGEVIRVKMFMVEGSQPDLKLILSKFRGTISFTGDRVKDLPPTSLYPPDDDGDEQNVTVLPEDAYVTDQRVRKDRHSKFFLRGFDPDVLPDGAPKTGWYQLVIRTNNRTVASTASGRYRSKRKRKVVLFGDESDNRLDIVLVQGDEIRKFVVKRIGKGSDAPELTELQFPSGASGQPSQKRNKRGSRTFLPIRVTAQSGNFGTGEGTFSYVVGYQEGGSAGAFKAHVKVRPRKSGATMQMGIRNPPGIPLSVRPTPERFVKVNSLGGGNWIDSTSDVGIVTDADYLYVSGEKGGQLLFRRLTHDLTVQNVDFNLIWVVADETADFPPGEFISGHRLLRVGDHFYAAVSSASGNYGRLYRFEVRFDDITGITTFLVNSTRELLPAGNETTTDMFLATDGATVSVGMYAGSASASQHVYRYDAVTLAAVGPNPTVIGRLSEGAGHTSAAGVSYREIVAQGQSAHYELWAPDNLSPAGPESNLHRQTYSADWSALLAPDRIYGFDYDRDGTLDPAIEQSPTAVTIDDDLGGGVQATGVTILHYVVPFVGSTGGEVHRRVFDLDGDEIEDSHFVLEVSGTRPAEQPVAVILNETAVRSHVYVAYKTDQGPEIQRFPIVR